MRYNPNKDFHQLIAHLVASGWTFSRGSKNDRITTPDGNTTLIVPRSPSDRHAIRDFRRRVERCIGQAPECVSRGPDKS